jgi:hypothetical protein
MPSKNPSLYPAIFHSIARASPSDFPLSLTLPSKKAAERLRFRWYRFRNALVSHHSPLYKTAEQLELSITELPDSSAELCFTPVSIVYKEIERQLANMLGTFTLPESSKTEEQLFKESLNPIELERYKRESAEVERYSKEAAEKLERGEQPTPFAPYAVDPIEALMATPSTPTVWTAEDEANRTARLVERERVRILEKAHNESQKQLLKELNEAGQIEPISPGSNSSVEEK